MTDAELTAYRKKVLGPAAVAARRLFFSEDGKVVFDALDRVFGRNLVAKTRDGKVDESATLIRIGNKEVIDYLRTLAENDEGGQG